MQLRTEKKATTN